MRKVSTQRTLSPFSLKSQSVTRSGDVSLAHSPSACAVPQSFDQLIITKMKSNQIVRVVCTTRCVLASDHSNHTLSFSLALPLFCSFRASHTMCGESSPLVLRHFNFPTKFKKSKKALISSSLLIFCPCAVSFCSLSTGACAGADLRSDRMTSALSASCVSFYQTHTPSASLSVTVRVCCSVPHTTSLHALVPVRSHTALRTERNCDVPKPTGSTAWR